MDALLADAYDDASDAEAVSSYTTLSCVGFCLYYNICTLTTLFAH